MFHLIASYRVKLQFEPVVLFTSFNVYLIQNLVIVGDGAATIRRHNRGYDTGHANPFQEVESQLGLQPQVWAF